MIIIEKAQCLNHSDDELEVENRGNDYLVKRFVDAYISLSNTNDENIKVFYELLCQDFTTKNQGEDSYKLFTHLLEILNKYISRKNSKPKSIALKH